MHTKDRIYYEDIKQRYMRYLMENPMSFRQLAAEVGVSQKTIRDFFHYRTDTTIKILAKLENYIQTKEREKNG